MGHPDLPTRSGVHLILALVLPPLTAAGSQKLTSVPGNAPRSGPLREDGSGTDSDIDQTAGGNKQLKGGPRSSGRTEDRVAGSGTPPRGPMVRLQELKVELGRSFSSRSPTEGKKSHASVRHALRAPMCAESEHEPAGVADSSTKGVLQRLQARRGVAFWWL